MGFLGLLNEVYEDHEENGEDDEGIEKKISWWWSTVRFNRP
jgi:hypothetical protein